MRILIIRCFPSFMDVENRTYNIQELGLAKALVKKGQVCDIILWTDREEKMVEVPVSGFGIVKVFYRKARSILRNVIFVNCDELFDEYDILQSSEYNQIQSWVLAKRYPEKTIIYHGPYYCEFNKRYNIMCKVFDLFLLPRYIRNKTKFIVKSNLAKDFLTGKGIDSNNISSVGVGVDVQMLSVSDYECKESLYLQLIKDQDKLKILYIGRFEQRRNLFFIIDVFKEILRKNQNARLYLVGSGEKEYVKNFFEYASACGCKEYIYWQEHIQQKYLSKIYKLADYFLLPTEYEIFGMVMLEAMMYKTIVLTTHNGGSSMLIENGRDGFILSEKEPNLWANCVLQCEREREHKCEIAKNAKLKIEGGFTWDVLVAKFITNYEDMLMHGR